MSTKKVNEINNEQKELLDSGDKHEGHTPKSIMSRHIKDENDIITDEEFENMEVGVDNEDTKHEETVISNDPNRPKDEDKDGKISTPWDVIN